LKHDAFLIWHLTHFYASVSSDRADFRSVALDLFLTDGTPKGGINQFSLLLKSMLSCNAEGVMIRIGANDTGI